MKTFLPLQKLANDCKSNCGLPWSRSFVTKKQHFLQFDHLIMRTIILGCGCQPLNVLRKWGRHLLSSSTRPNQCRLQNTFLKSSSSPPSRERMVGTKRTSWVPSCSHKIVSYSSYSSSHLKSNKII
jgi:hypothetical protein